VFIVDAHLDLAYNALRGRDVLRPAAEQQGDQEGIPTVGLPDLRAGGVGLVCATIFRAPAIEGKPGYRSPDEARDASTAQLDWYQRQVASRRKRLVRTRHDLPDVNEPRPAGGAQPFILLLEGADPIRSPGEVRDWFHFGLRVVGLAWKRTRHAGGTGMPGPLTPEGVALLKELDRFGIIHDASHLAEESFWQLMELSRGPVMSSHSNSRAIVPTDRQLSDDMVRAIVARDGVLGINFYDKFLLPPDEHGKRRATLADVVRHVRHFCDVAGDAAHVGLGTDMDGGLGREQIPQEIRTSADLPRLADALSADGFTDAEIGGILGSNWLRFFAGALPAAPIE